jgi:hypothetical protein
MHSVGSLDCSNGLKVDIPTTMHSVGSLDCSNGLKVDIPNIIYYYPTI